MTEQHTFTRAELRELAPGDLADLLKMADGDTPWESAMSLGLDPTNPNDRKVVQAAVLAVIDEGTPYSPPIGAGQDGVRSDLTPIETEQPAPHEEVPEPSSDGYGLPEPDAAGAADLAAAIAHSAEAGRPFMAGTFALYGDPSGAVVLVTEDAAGNVRRSVVPRKVVRLALGLMSGERSGMAGFLAKRLGRG